jgi:hypothetical protein
MHDIDKIYLIKGFLTDHNAPRGRRAGSQVHFKQRPSRNKHKLPPRNLRCIESKHPLINRREEKKKENPSFFIS